MGLVKPVTGRAKIGLAPQPTFAREWYCPVVDLTCVVGPIQLDPDEEPHEVIDINAVFFATFEVGLGQKNSGVQFFVPEFIGQNVHRGSSFGDEIQIGCYQVITAVEYC